MFDLSLLKVEHQPVLDMTEKIPLQGWNYYSYGFQHGEPATCVNKEFLSYQVFTKLYNDLHDTYK